MGRQSMLQPEDRTCLLKLPVEPSAMFGPDAAKILQQAQEAHRCAHEVSGALRQSREWHWPQPQPQPHQLEQPQPPWSQGDLRGRLDATRWAKSKQGGGRGHGGQRPPQPLSQSQCEAAPCLLGPSGASCGMEDPGGGPLVCFDNDPGVSAAVYEQTSSNEADCFFYHCRTSAQRGFAFRDLHSPDKKGHQGGEARKSAGGVLLPIFPFPEMGWHSQAYLGAQEAEQVSQTSEVQDVDGTKGKAGCSCRRLVCNSQPQGCICSDTDLGGSQEVPQVRLRGQDLRVLCTPFRDLVGPPHLHKVYGCGFGAFEAAGSQGLQLP